MNLNLSKGGLFITYENIESKSKSSIWKNSIFVKVYSSAFISSVGDRLVLFVLPLWIMKITDSSLLVSILNATITATTAILTPFTGTMADRFSRRKLMISADLLRFIIMTTLVLLLVGNHFSYYTLLILIFFRSFGTSISSPSANAAIVTFVSEEHVDDAVALRQTMNQVISVGGPLLGGILVGFISYNGIFIIDALTFLLSVLVLTSLKFPKDITVKKQKKFWEDMKEGVFLIYKNPLLKVLLFSAALINILGSALILCLQVFVVRDLNLSHVWWSLIFASSPIGLIIGSLVSRKINLNTKVVSFAFIFVLICGIFNVLMGLTTNPLIFTILYFLSGVGFGMSNVYFGILYRKIVPTNKQGRFFGFLNSILLISTPIGVTLTGFVLENLRASILIVIIGLLTIVTAAISYLVIRSKAQVESISLMEKKVEQS